jgi:hypothetical protein
VKTNALIVFFKWPVPGEVKTRLIPNFGAELAAQIYEAFIKDCLEKVRDLDMDVIGFYGNNQIENTHKPLKDFFATLGVKLFKQEGEDLGQRMLGAISQVLDQGYKHVGLIGTDSPDLPPEVLKHAFQALSFSNNAFSLGPSEDGGYYFIGMNRPYPGAFHNVQYSTETTLLETVTNLSIEPCSLYILKRWYDIDEPVDLKRLQSSLHPELLTHTNQVLSLTI